MTVQVRKSPKKCCSSALRPFTELHDSLAWSSIMCLVIRGVCARAKRVLIARVTGPAAWRAALELAPDDPPLVLALGTVVAAQQRVDEAVTLLRRAVALDSSAVSAWTQLGVALFMRHDLGSAGEALRRALALAPENLSARHHLSMVLLARGDRDSAVRELDRILLIDPAYVPARLDLAVHALDAADYDRALGHLDAALQADDGNQRARFNEHFEN